MTKQKFMALSLVSSIVDFASTLSSPKYSKESCEHWLKELRKQLKLLQVYRGSSLDVQYGNR